MDANEPTPLAYLDSKRSRAFAADYAGSTNGPSYEEAITVTRSADFGRLEAAVDLWAAQNRFRLISVSTNDLGINIIINTPGMDDMIEKSTYSFVNILTAFDFTQGGFMIHNQATGEFHFA